MKLNYFALLLLFIAFGLSCKKEELSQSFLSEIQNKEDKGLKKEDAFALMAQQYSYVVETSENELRAQWDAKQVENGNSKLRFAINTFGAAPADGHSLFISLHDGGDAPAAINDEKWLNQIYISSNNPKLYNIREGVVIVPRAPTNATNMWYTKDIDDLMDKLIRAAVIFANVNPNKVYLMGYGAGGDGVYRLASRMAEKWAAVSASAGCPGNTSPENFRNVGVAISAGALDTYNEIDLAVPALQTKLDNFQKTDADAYHHQVNIFANKAQWMDLEDRIAVSFMATFKRQPYPEKVIWVQNSVNPKLYSYWLGIGNADATLTQSYNNPHMAIVATRNGNNINIESNFANELKIFLSDKMVNLDLPISISYQGKEIFNGLVKRSAAVIEATTSERKDSNYIFNAEITVKNNQTVKIAD